MFIIYKIDYSEDSSYLLVGPVSPRYLTATSFGLFSGNVSFYIIHFYN